MEEFSSLTKTRIETIDIAKEKIKENEKIPISSKKLILIFSWIKIFTSIILVKSTFLSGK